MFKMSISISYLKSNFSFMRCSCVYVSGPLLSRGESDTVPDRELTVQCVEQRSIRCEQLSMKSAWMEGGWERKAPGVGGKMIPELSWRKLGKGYSR